ncbi:MAG: MlaE family lipid ABC transporter permease subunit [Loktanella sp.]|nr:MlaE family lipid ABC transporter permease subunit [Loktanella sp.]
MERPEFSIEDADDGDGIALAGVLSIKVVSRLDAALGALPVQDTRLDLSGVTHVDTAGAWSILGLERRLESAGQTLDITGASKTAAQLIETVRNALPDPQEAEDGKQSVADRLEAFGQGVVASAGYGLALVNYLGLFVARLGRAIRHPGTFRMTALVHHCQEVGLKAVPIVSLMAFLIGVVLAFQGSAQLRQFGAEVFVVDLIAISILRELGILLTSIIVAGRTASAFTAAIGSMKMREEIDAMRTLGLDPATVLFVPRILALVLMLPILGLIANVMGLLGGAIMSWVELGISPAMFRTRLVEGTDISHVMVGMVKAPVFALIIGIIGCHAGMQVESNAESLGRQTSNAVVAAIFAVIVADAGFSIFFAQMGI